MHSWSASVRDITLLAIFSLAFWAPLGRWLLRRFGAGDLARGFAIPAALGMGAWGLSILALGLMGGLYRWVLILLAVTLFAGMGLHRHFFPLSRESARYRFSRGHWLVVGGFALPCLIYFGIALGSSLAPETSFDALNVHLPYARDAAAAHRAGFEPNNWSSAMPALPLMTYITAFVFSGLTLVKLTNLLCYLLAGGFAYLFVLRWWGQAPALAAALLFWSCPVAVYEATTALIDLPLTMYSALAVFAMLEWAGGGAKFFLWLSAVALGLAFGCKYHAAFWFVPCLLIIAWHALRRLRLNAARTLAIAAGYFGIVGILALPWLLRAWAFTGNPVFPAANRIFKSPFFPPAMEAAAMAAYANEGVGAGLKSLLQLPWTVTAHPGFFRGTLGWIFLVGVAAAICRKKTPQVRCGLAAAFFYFYTWALTAQDIRYLLPLVPLLAALAAAGLVGRGGDLSRVESAPTRFFPDRLAHAAGLMLVLAGSLTALPPVYPSIVKEWTYWHAYQSPLAYLSGRETAQDFLKRDVPSIYVYDYINAALGPGDRILLLNDASRFYSRVPTLYSFTVEAERLLFEESEEAVLRRLKESRITHVLLNYNGIAPIPGVAPRRGVYFFLDKSFRSRKLETVFEKNNVVLYRVR